MLRARTDTRPRPAKRRFALLAALLLAALCALAAHRAPDAPAVTPREELERTERRLERVRGKGRELARTIAEQNRAIDALIGEVSTLRRRQAAVEAELAAKQRRLDRATAALERERERLEAVRAQLRRALGVLADRLVAIYEAGTPDVLDAVLGSGDWSQAAAQAEYLSSIQDYDDAVVERVKELRDEVRGAVRRLAAARAAAERARDEVAAAREQIASARREAEARFAELRAAQAERRRALEALESREAALSSNLAAITEQVASEGGPVPTGQAPPPLTPGQRARVISPSRAAAPASAPAAVKAVIAAANAIAHTPYLWGGGHGSFESPGYDCSGAVSYALHGGGLLSSPLDSTGLTTWGAPGPGKWITVYGNAGHAWMMVAGIAFDTSGGPGPRWHSPPVNSPAGFIARHPPGL